MSWVSHKIHSVQFLENNCFTLKKKLHENKIKTKITLEKVSGAQVGLSLMSLLSKLCGSLRWQETRSTIWLPLTRELPCSNSGSIAVRLAWTKRQLSDFSGERVSISHAHSTWICSAPKSLIIPHLPCSHFSPLFVHSRPLVALSGKPRPGNGTSHVTAIEVAASPFGVLCLEQTAGPETGEYRTQLGIIFILIFLLGYPSFHHLSRALKVGCSYIFCLFSSIDAFWPRSSEPGTQSPQYLETQDFVDWYSLEMQAFRWKHLCSNHILEVQHKGDYNQFVKKSNSILHLTKEITWRFWPG